MASKSKKTYILLIVLLVLIVIALPGRMAWGKRNAALEDKRAFEDRTAELEMQIVMAEAVVNNRDEWEAKVTRGEETMPVDGTVDLLIDDLVDLVVASGLTWESGSPDVIIESDLARYTMSMSLIGTKESTFELIEQFRVFDRLVTLSELSLTFPQSADGEARDPETDIVVYAPGWLSTPEDVAAASADQEGLDGASAAASAAPEGS